MLDGTDVGFEARVKRSTLHINGQKVSTEFFPAAAGDAACTILDLASPRQESETPMVSQPYMIAMTPAVRAMRAELTPSSLSASYP